MKGEFEKQATSIHNELGKLRGGESTAVKNLVRLEVIDKARKDFPDKDRMEKVREIIEKHFPKEHTFSKRYILDTIQVYIDLREEWFGTKEEK